MSVVEVQWFGGPCDGETVILPDGSEYVQWAEPVNVPRRGLLRNLPPSPALAFYEARIYEQPGSGRWVINYGYRQPIEAISES